MDIRKCFILSIMFLLFFGCAIQRTSGKGIIEKMMPGRGPVHSRFIQNPMVQTTYPVNVTKGIRPYKMVKIWAPTGDSIVYKDIKPDLEYEILGTIEFFENWYGEKEIGTLIDEAVSSIGGDAVLEYTCSQIGAADVLTDEWGVPADSYYHQSFKIVVIKFKQKT